MAPKLIIMYMNMSFFSVFRFFKFDVKNVSCFVNFSVALSMVAARVICVVCV